MPDANTTSIVILIGVNIGLTVAAAWRTRRILDDIERLRRDLAQRYINVR